MKKSSGGGNSHALLVRIIAGVCAVLIAISTFFLAFFS